MVYELEERRIPVSDLKVGMYVCRLDRPWEGTPFPLQGVELTGPEDIATLRSLCTYVYVDARRMVGEPVRSVLMRSDVDEGRFARATEYVDVAPVSYEAPRAREALVNANAIVDAMLNDVMSGAPLAVEQVELAVRPLVASVLRSADAFFWVEGLRGHDSYTFSHAVNCSALAAAFGRHLGFAQDTIVSLAAAGLLMDVGKMRVRQQLLERSGPLSTVEMDEVRRHVEEGVQVVTEAGIADPDVIDAVRSHHERYDGNGYPDRLAGSAIPLAGRMLGIVDSYDAMVGQRPYRAPISRHAALRQIYAGREVQFQSELVEQFQVCMGVYPTGSLVELSTGEIAVVMAQNHARRLQPKVVLLTTPEKMRVNQFQIVDLMSRVDRDKTVNIVRSVTADDYGIDTSELFLAA